MKYCRVLWATAGYWGFWEVLQGSVGVLQGTTGTCGVMHSAVG